MSSRYREYSVAVIGGGMPSTAGCEHTRMRPAKVGLLHRVLEVLCDTPLHEASPA